MKKISILLSALVLAAMILAACGGEETSTNIPSTNVPPVTIEATETSGASSATEISTVTEVPTEVTSTSALGTPGIPVTGATNSELLSKELDFTVWDQSGQQVGKVDDMVLDLSKAKVIYVVVNADGKKIPVPWALLKVGPASVSYPNEQQNAFTLQADPDTLKKAPVLDLKNVPELGAEPDSWDISFRKYWEGSSGAFSSSNTPSPAGTVVSDMTATATSISNSAVTSQGTGQGATSIQGVQLASKVLGAKITVGVPELNLGTSTPSAAGAGTGLATSTSSAGTTLTTSTPSIGTGLATATSSAGASLPTSTPSADASSKNLSATVTDMIVNNDAGEIMYIIIKTSVENSEHLIPIPLSLFKLDTNNESFVVNADPEMFQNAPFFQKDQFPDLTMPGWNSEFDSFWQNNGAGGSSGTSAQATATP